MHLVVSRTEACAAGRKFDYSSRLPARHLKRAVGYSTQLRLGRADHLDCLYESELVPGTRWEADEF